MKVVPILILMETSSETSLSRVALFSVGYIMQYFIYSNLLTSTLLRQLSVCFSVASWNAFQNEIRRCEINTGLYQRWWSKW